MHLKKVLGWLSFYIWLLLYLAFFVEGLVLVYYTKCKERISNNKLVK